LTITSGGEPGTSENKNAKPGFDQEAEEEQRRGMGNSQKRGNSRPRLGGGKKPRAWLGKNKTDK